MAVSIVLNTGADTCAISGADSTGLITFTSSAAGPVSRSSVKVVYSATQASPRPVVLTPIGLQVGMHNPPSFHYHVGDTATVKGFFVDVTASDGGIPPSTPFKFFYYTGAFQ
ncbi:MAG TPA: hypothetical protein VMD05_07975 [Candidatus Nanoarchaeia archaeon]|nr:hypothetical protein [Candidatus Nanoarchaeia archaeon]